MIFGKKGQGFHQFSFSTDFGILLVGMAIGAGALYYLISSGFLSL